MINRVCPLCSGCSGVCSPATPGKAAVQQDVYKMHWPAHGHPTQPLNAAVALYKEPRRHWNANRHWSLISNFSAGLLPPKESPPQRKNAKKELPPARNIDHWSHSEGMSSRLMRYSLNSSRRGKGMACLAFGNSFLCSFHGAHVYSRKRHGKKARVTCPLGSEGVAPSTPDGSKGKTNQFIHIWSYEYESYHSCTKLMMPCRTWWLEKAGPIAQTHMLVLFAVEMLPL